MIVHSDEKKERKPVYFKYQIVREKSGNSNSTVNYVLFECMFKQKLAGQYLYRNCIKFQYKHLIN